MTSSPSKPRLQTQTPESSKGFSGQCPQYIPVRVFVSSRRADNPPCLATAACFSGAPSRKGQKPLRGVASVPEARISDITGSCSTRKNENQPLPFAKVQRLLRLSPAFFEGVLIWCPLFRLFSDENSPVCDSHPLWVSQLETFSPPCKRFFQKARNHTLSVDFFARFHPYFGQLAFPFLF